VAGRAGLPARSAVFGALASTVSLLGLMAPGAVLAQQSPAPETATQLPEVRVIATTPASAVSSPRRAPSGGPAAPRPTPATSPPPAEVAPIVTADPTVIDRDNVPSNTESLTADDFSRTYSPSVTDALLQRVPGVAVRDVQRDAFTQELRWRGFTASPLPAPPR